MKKYSISAILFATLLIQSLWGAADLEFKSSNFMSRPKVPVSYSSKQSQIEAEAARIEELNKAKTQARQLTEDQAKRLAKAQAELKQSAINKEIEEEAKNRKKEHEKDLHSDYAAIYDQDFYESLKKDLLETTQSIIGIHSENFKTLSKMADLIGMPINSFLDNNVNAQKIIDYVTSLISKTDFLPEDGKQLVNTALENIAKKRKIEIPKFVNNTNNRFVEILLKNILQTYKYVIQEKKILPLTNDTKPIQPVDLLAPYKQDIKEEQTRAKQQEDEKISAAKEIAAKELQIKIHNDQLAHIKAAGLEGITPQNYLDKIGCPKLNISSKSFPIDYYHDELIGFKKDFTTIFKKLSPEQAEIIAQFLLDALNHDEAVAKAQLITKWVPATQATVDSSDEKEIAELTEKYSAIEDYAERYKAFAALHEKQRASADKKEKDKAIALWKEQEVLHFGKPLNLLVNNILARMCAESSKVVQVDLYNYKQIMPPLKEIITFIGTQLHYPGFKATLRPTISTSESLASGVSSSGLQTASQDSTLSLHKISDEKNDSPLSIGGFLK